MRRFLNEFSGGGLKSGFGRLSVLAHELPFEGLEEAFAFAPLPGALYVFLKYMHELALVVSHFAELVVDPDVPAVEGHFLLLY